MRQLTFTFLAAAFLFTSSLGTAHADLANYSTNFTSADGFTEGGDVNGVDGWIANTSSDTVNVGSNGQFSILSNGNANVQIDSGGSFGVGDSVTVSAEIFYNGSFSNNENFRLGLTDGTAINTGVVRAGTEFQANALAGNLRFNGYSNGGSTTSSQIDTGVDGVLGTSTTNHYTYTTTITKSATANEFDVSWSWSGDAQNDSFTITHAALYGAANVYGTIQYNGPTTGGGRVIVDSYSQDFTAANAIPEPTSLALFGIAATGMLIGRRR